MIDGNESQTFLSERGAILPANTGPAGRAGGLAALREINRYGFAWAQLDAMERFWAGLQQGKVINRAGQWIDVAAASGAAAGGLKVIGSGVGASIAPMRHAALQAGIGRYDVRCKSGVWQRRDCSANDGAYFNRSTAC